MAITGDFFNNKSVAKKYGYNVWLFFTTKVWQKSVAITCGFFYNESMAKKCGFF